MIRPSFPSNLCAIVVMLGLISGCAHPSYVMTKDGVRVAYEHHAVPESAGTAVLLHGLGSSYDEWYSLRGFLNKQGWSTLAIDFRGHGDSLEWKEKELDWRGFSDEGIATLQRDIEAAISVLEPNEPLWLIGSSMGANMALKFVGDGHKAKGLVLLSPVYNFRGIQSEEEMLSVGFVPVLFVGSEDDVGTPEVCRLLHGIAEGPKKLIILKEAGHGSAMLDNEESLKGEILTWMNQKTA